MVHGVDELKRRSIEIDTEIDDLQRRIVLLQQQRAAFDVVIQVYDPEHAPAASHGVVRRRSKGGNDISLLFKDFDRRSFVLRTLREAGRPISTAECASAFAIEIGLEQDDPRMGKIGNRFSQVLDQLAKAKRVHRAGMVDGHRLMWEVST